MKTGILILLTSLICDLQLSGQTIPENVTLKQLDGKEITFKEAVQQGPVIVSFCTSKATVAALFLYHPVKV